MSPRLVREPGWLLPGVGVGLPQGLDQAVLQHAEQPLDAPFGLLRIGGDVFNLKLPERPPQLTEGFFTGQFLLQREGFGALKDGVAFGCTFVLLSRYVNRRL